MTASPPKTRLIVGFSLWLFASTIIGALASLLSASQFQLHVRVFYFPGVQHRAVMHFVADLAVAVLPFALIAPALGPAYYCWRKRIPLSYLFVCCSIGSIIGLYISPSIQGLPDQPFRHVIPAFVFVAAVTALAIQIMFEDWVLDTPASPTRPRHCNSSVGS